MRAEEYGARQRRETKGSRLGGRARDGSRKEITNRPTLVLFTQLIGRQRSSAFARAHIRVDRKRTTYLAEREREREDQRATIRAD